MSPIILLCFFPNSENKWISFQNLHGPRGVIFHICFQFSLDLWTGTDDYWYSHGMWPIILVYFSQLKRWKWLFQTLGEKICPWIGTEFARDFCAGIGPLQLGVVLVLYLFAVTISHIVMSFHAIPLYASMYDDVQFLT